MQIEEAVQVEGKAWNRKAVDEGSSTGHSEDQPTVSVIIPALNEERYIEQCLRSIRGLDYPSSRLEVIVIDNGSIDRTVSIAKDYADKLYILRHARVGALRNYGASEASADILAFLDADCVVRPSWLQWAVRSLSVGPCVTGAEYEVSENATWVERAWFSQTRRGRHVTTHINGGNLFVHKQLFNKVGGFDVSLVSGEDYEFCQRVRRYGKIIADSRIRVVHMGNPKTLRQFFRREVWHGLGMLGSAKLNWKDRPLGGTLAFLVLTVTQLSAIPFLQTPHGSSVMTASISGIGLLLSATVLYRARRMDTLSTMPALILLYYFYYLARCLSLVLLLTQRTDFRRVK
jgi:GT2 family glycosyltransferase